MEPITGDDAVCVAVGRDIDESKLTLAWALKSFPRRKICILHVHQRAQTISSITEGFQPSSLVEQDELRKIANDMRDRVLDEYLLICRSAGKLAEKLHIEMDDVAKGIVELVRQHKIKELVMGAAANKHYTEEMTYLKSEKALHVKQYVPPHCDVWFVCSGHLIHPRLVFEARSSTAPSSSYVTGSNGGGTSSLDLTLFEEAEESQCGQSYEGSSNGQLEDALLEAEKENEKALEGLVKRMQAQRNAIHAVCSEARKFEKLYDEEFRRRRQTEAELERLKRLRDEENLCAKEALLESRSFSSGRMKEEFECKISSLMQQLELCEKERDKLKVELDDARELNDQILGRQEEETSSLNLQEFSISDVHRATNECDPSMKVGEGTNGSIIYKGLLYHTQVAIKVLYSNGSEAISEYQREVDILSKVRHPNVVTLIGACPEAWTLIYEYLPNGSLDDCLSCKNNSPPLPWQTRIRIATELCSVLIFLHSCKPQGIVHGDLKPGNILLDANFACKLSDFGLCRLLSDKSVICRTSPKGTFGYLDPEFYATGELTPQSDVYSFGIILLQLLTGRFARGIAKEVQSAIDAKRLNHLLDPLAGDWPFVQAEQLANLALRCCQVDRKNRPDLETEVLRVLEPMRAACGHLPTSGLGSEVQFQPPSYLICPIFQEIMQDPHVASDGFTYEAEALRGWLEGGNSTSPMTNLELSHQELVPNHALRSAIQEWLQQH